ncbi:MAG: hypothetical protein NTV49_12105 [Kiritimatiellaeota bacterium]|nr:hypothetical protein [Kiritimatiellota bacterium]
MKNWKSTVSMALGAVCLVLAIAVVWIGQTAQQLQMQLQQKQNEINSGLLGQTGQKLGSSILSDMANLALSDQRMRKLLTDNGYTINVNPTSGGSASDAAPKNARKTNE